MKQSRHQHIYDLAEVCARHGIRQAVICPGSRSAPLVLGFSNHKSITCRIIPDERAAGFIALGIAQATKTPVVLICTSGTAAYNFAPAVAEAFYQEIPLLICTADRPVEWIGQRDGQTIVQNQIYGSHVKSFFDVQAEDQPEGAWLSNRMMNEAILISKSENPGPVHLNFPFREPLYPAATEKISFGKPRIMRELRGVLALNTEELTSLTRRISSFKKILIIAGQNGGSENLKYLLNKIKVPVVTEVISNISDISNEINNADILLSGASDQSKKYLKPDLLITWGMGVVSKQVKLFLRNYSAAEHWHIQEYGKTADTFKQLTQVIRCTPEYFIQHIFFKSKNQSNITRSSYLLRWKKLNQEAGRIIENVLDQSASEASLIQEILRQLPTRCDLHLSNSMSVRHANLAGLPNSKKKINVFANRGTSGIDGCTSTAVGHQLMKKESQVLITGDVAFFYDNNAFWHGENISGMRICLINNHGGRIFQIIDGPKGRQETERFFVGPQSRNAQTFCKENQINYFQATTADLKDRKKIKKQLAEFMKPGADIRLMEFFFESGDDLQILEKIKREITEIKL